MTELEDVIIKPLTANGTIKLYSRFVDEILLVMKHENVSQVGNTLNKFEKNLRFTVHIFQNKVPHFLYLELSPDEIKAFKKQANTVLIVNFTSFVFRLYCISWIRNFVTHDVSCISSIDKLSPEINTTKNWLCETTLLSQLSVQ